MVSKVIQSTDVLKNDNTVECVKNYSGENINNVCSELKMLKNGLFPALTLVPLLCLGQASKKVKPGLENITVISSYSSIGA